jgi:Ca2+-binding EF-hand superfamily protein
MANFKRIAASIIQRQDKNKTGRLERDEWEGLPPNLRDADTNGDGVLTEDEIAQKLADYSRSGGQWGRREPRDDASRNATQAASGRKSYRLAAMVPADADSDFRRMDANEDGQVSMAEFSVVWSEEKATDFQRKDLNGDGFISYQEWSAGKRR